MKKVMWIVLGWLALNGVVQAASFDCAKAESNVEKAICQNSEISELDSRLGKVYQHVLEKLNSGEKPKLVEEQKHWLRLSRNVCAKETCLKHAYWSRLAVLENYFEPRSPLYEKETDKAEAIKQVLATAPLYPTYATPLCTQIFEALKLMTDVELVDPVVQTQSYEDPALDPWKSQCQWAPPLNFSYSCNPNDGPGNADEVISQCRAGYGLPPYKLFEIPGTKVGDEKRHFFYADEAFGPMNQDWKRPSLGGGMAGFRQLNLPKCLGVANNYWDPQGREINWRGTFASTGRGGRSGKNFNSIIEYAGKYYFFILNMQRESYWLDVSSIDAQGATCRWTPVKK